MVVMSTVTRNPLISASIARTVGTSVHGPKDPAERVHWVLTIHVRGERGGMLVNGLPKTEQAAQKWLEDFLEAVEIAPSWMTIADINAEMMLCDYVGT